MPSPEENRQGNEKRPSGKTGAKPFGGIILTRRYSVMTPMVCAT